ncbi:hypothetical protein [Sorangium sp. So ce1151]|uniref:hypothetical protein n=1 Tax=Sorangium sp. So ce1151 TaxID=3133332 RepID=UPI003F604D43
MSTAEKLSIASLCVSMLSVIVAFIALSRATKVSADSAHATLFFLIDRDLSTARATYLNRLHALMVAKSANPASEQAITSADALLIDAQETLCNVIDNACAQYLDGRLDKVRFKKSYCDAFREHVRQTEFADRYREGSRHQPTIKCIREWNPA